jgi:AcrR family transcriptional regulator
MKQTSTTPAPASTIGRSARAERAESTRGLILATAARLFAEHGVYAVSNRQISEAAGQGNNTAVGYHFGTKTDLVRAIVHEHAGRMEQIRRDLVPRSTGEDELRAWVTCLVRPLTDHLAELGSPTWYARCAAQFMTDPALRQIITEDAMDAPALQQSADGLARCLPHLPRPVHAARMDMVRDLIVHTCADQERALADRPAAPGPAWAATATGLIDAITGLLRAPATP